MLTRMLVRISGQTYRNVRRVARAIWVGSVPFKPHEEHILRRAVMNHECALITADVRHTTESGPRADQLATQCCRLTRRCQRNNCTHARTCDLITERLQVESITYSCVKLPDASQKRSLLDMLQSHNATMSLSGHVLFALKQPSHNAHHNVRVTDGVEMQRTVTSRTESSQCRIQRWLITQANSDSLE